MQAPAVAGLAAKRVTYLDPTGHIHADQRQMSHRIKDIKGSVAALLDNGNDTSNFFFQGLAKVLQEEYGVSKIIMETKYTSTKPADQEMLETMSKEADFMVAGVCL